MISISAPAQRDAIENGEEDFGEQDGRCGIMFSSAVATDRVGFKRGGTVTEKEMSIQEIEARFDSEWVLEDPQTNEALEVLSGRVLHHSKDRDEVYRVVTLRPKRSTILYTGEIPENTAIVL